MKCRFIFLILCTLFLSACSDSEEEARIIYNKALQDWGNGNIKESLEKFETISLKYLNTKTATDAINRKAVLLEQYKKLNDPLTNQRKNAGKIGKLVVNEITRYHASNNLYPQNIKLLNIKSRDNLAQFIQLCQYSVAELNLGYQLDCNKAENDYRNFLKKQRQSKISISSQRKKDSIDFSYTTNYPKALKTWGNALNPTGKFSKNGFSAFYINTNNPNNIIYSEMVDDISINYAWDKFRGIKSEDFGGYWVGEIECKEQKPQQISINQGHSKTRLIIDNFIIYEGGSNKELIYDCKPGKHKVEVEYVNNWHTTEFSLRISNQVQYFLLDEISTQLRKVIGGNIETNLVSVYESSKKDLSLTVNIQKSVNPQVLFLNSYSPVKWRISNPYKVDILAIIYRSYSPGAMVTGDINSNTVLMATKEKLGKALSKPYQKCSCQGGHFHCEGGDILSNRDVIERITKSKLTGFTMTYATDSLIAPQTLLNDDYLSELENISEKNRKLKESCKNKNSPDFENMFKSSN
ncbi:hypothetical protein [uncultured Desulfobacter sp.]|uniref:hypothetical protein n=1 Tax=uncultured Desulfobacter sp. TaxID=240139 RepID=UPI0029F5BA9C|nr:hypothetical protein [uncultured Desulfobacter sp.]